MPPTRRSNQECDMSAPAGGPTEGANKYIALMIAVLALFLAFSEMLGKNAEKASVTANIEANNLWSFFQAKTIRRAMAQNLVEFIQVENTGVTDAAKSAAVAKQVETWRSLAARLESEPETNEGRRELMRRAQEAEKKRDSENRKAEAFEMSSAVLVGDDHHRRRLPGLRRGGARHGGGRPYGHGAIRAGGAAVLTAEHRSGAHKPHCEHVTKTPCAAIAAVVA
jgi:hypothetical protein